MKSYAAMAAACLVLMGCAPTPEKLCKRLEELNAKPEKCEMRLKVQSSQDEAAFKKTAECINKARTVNAAKECMRE